MPIDATTLVFWDVEDFPVPPGYSVRSITDQIKKAILNEGYDSSYREDLTFAGYSKDLLPIKEAWHFREAGVLFVHIAEEKCSRLQCILLDLIHYASENLPADNGQEVNLLVIAKDCTEEDMGFYKLLEDLEKRRFNVFLVVPDDCTPQQMPPIEAASLVWRWTKLCNGENSCSDSEDFDPVESKPNDAD